MYDDARLAAVYDVDNPDGPDHDFFRALADEVSATRIVDLGCGTGILTVTLTRDDREVTGIDPAPPCSTTPVIAPARTGPTGSRERPTSSRRTARTLC